MANGFTPGPGMVTSNVVGSTYSADPETQRMMLQRQWELEDRRRAEREARNREIVAQRQAGAAARGAEQDRTRLKKAFQEVYGPLLLREFHDAEVGAATPEGFRRRNEIGARFRGLGAGSPYASGTAFNKGFLQPSLTARARVGPAVEEMWRRQMDPYYQAAMRMWTGSGLGGQKLGGQIMESTRITPARE